MLEKKAIANQLTLINSKRTMPRDMNWLVLCGPLGSYMVALYEELSERFGIKITIIHSPLPAKKEFLHEQPGESGCSRFVWEKMGLSKIRRHIRALKPDLVLICGTKPRFLLAWAVANIEKSVPIFFFSDANIYALVQERHRGILKKLAYSLLSRRATACSLGFTNELAHRAVGFRKVADSPLSTLLITTPGNQTRARRQKQNQVAQQKS